MLHASSADLDVGQIFNFAQFGLLGVIFLAILGKKWLVPKWTLDDLKDAHERELAVKDEVIAGQRADILELKATVNELHSLTGKEVIPALTQANSLSAAYVAELARRGT